MNFLKAISLDDVVLEKLCEAMNDTETKFPDSNLTLNYKMVSP